MAHCYDDERRLLELQAKTGRLSKSAAQRQLQILMEERADELEKVAGDLHWQPGMSTAYRAMAKEVRDSIPSTLEKVAGTAEECTSLHKVVTSWDDRSRRAEAKMDMLEKSIAADPTRRPIGMPAPATATPTAPTLRRGPDNGPTWPSKPVAEMTNEQAAAYYKRLFREAPTPADARMWSEMAEKYAEAARKEGN